MTTSITEFFFRLAVLFSIVVSGAQADTLHGVRSSFLLNDIFQDKFGTSLMYLSNTWNNTERLNYITRLKNNGDTHIDVYARASSGVLPGGIVDPNENLHAKLKQLNDNGLKPVLWMTGEQRHNDYKKSQAVHEAFIDKTIAQSDGQVAAYVVCLECDEYWSAATVNHYVNYIKQRTNKPVAVHLAPGVGGYKKDINYYKNADYIFLQIGDHLTGDYVADTELAKSMLNEALQLGMPVVANEYSYRNENAASKALGDLMCQMGAVGTGNGRTIQFCGAEEVSKKKDYNTEIVAVLGIAAIAVGAYYLHTNYDFELKFDATDNWQSYGTGKSFALTDSLNFNADYTHTVTDSFNNNRVLFSFSGTF
jgi:hypothetical protein